MAKLHELLAVDGNLRKQADSTRKDLINTFDKKKRHFTKKIVTFTPSSENGDGAAREPVKEEVLDLQTTVKRELDWITDHVTKALDVAHQVSVANTQAKADVVLENGVTLLKSVPATSLLELEKRMNEIRELVAAIPTLDPVLGFSPATEEGIGIFVAREVVRTRTQKETIPIELSKATDKHPANVQLISKDVPIGTVKTQEWSSMLTTGEKGEMLDRVEILARAVKKARSRANELDVEVAGHKIGNTLLKYVFEGAAE